MATAAWVSNGTEQGAVFCVKKGEKMQRSINRNGKCSGESLKSKVLTSFSVFRGPLLNTNSACWNLLWYCKVPAAT